MTRATLGRVPPGFKGNASNNLWHQEYRMFYSGNFSRVRTSFWLSFVCRRFILRFTETLWLLQHDRRCVRSAYT